MTSPRVHEGATLPDTVDIRADVVVCGSGAGGATVAAELAEGGLDVVLLEEGGYHPTSSFDTEAPEAIRTLYRHAGTEVVLGDSPVMYAEGRCVGGSTVINGGICWRTPDEILDGWVREHGLPELSPGALAPLFERVERRIHVAPQDPGTVGGDSDVLKRGADALGWLTRPVRRNQIHCAGSANCIFGCPTGAKQSSLVTYVPRLLAAGGHLYADCRVEKVVRRGGRAVGVEASILDRETERVRGRLRCRARRVVVACGALRSPALLLKSGIRHPAIGRNLRLHPNAKAVAIMPETTTPRGTIQGWQVHEFADRGIVMATTLPPPGMLALSLPFVGEESRAIMEQYDRMVSSGILCEDDRSEGRVRLDPLGNLLATYRFDPRDRRRLLWGLSRLCELYFAAGAERVLVPIHGHSEVRSAEEARALASLDVPPGDIELITVHAMGTAAMGRDPSRSVVDARGECHGVPGLHVVDASVFPGPIGVNPQVTIMTVATRVAHAILEEHGLEPSPDVPALDGDRPLAAAGAAT